MQEEARLPHVSVSASVRMGPVCAFRKRVGLERSKPPATGAERCSYNTHLAAQESVHKRQGDSKYMMKATDMC